MEMMIRPWSLLNFIHRRRNQRWRMRQWQWNLQELWERFRDYISLFHKTRKIVLLLTMKMVSPSPSHTLIPVTMDMTRAIGSILNSKPKSSDHDNNTQPMDMTLPFPPVALQQTPRHSTPNPESSPFYNSRHPHP